MANSSIPRIIGEPPTPPVDRTGLSDASRKRARSVAAVWNGLAITSAILALPLFVFAAATLWDSSDEWIDKIPEAAIYIGGLAAFVVFAAVARTVSVNYRIKGDG